uniref:Uncharacterized protein n=1 Tax=Coptotermes formosanus TaxID=36987 RepID=R4V2J0_COPFO|nr:hypothetical protein [Coptotermes formosanus]
MAKKRNYFKSLSQTKDVSLLSAFITERCPLYAHHFSIMFLEEFFVPIPFSEKKHPSVLEGFQLLRENKSALNAKKALDCFKLAALDEDTEGEFVFAVMFFHFENNFKTFSLREFETTIRHHHPRPSQSIKKKNYETTKMYLIKAMNKGCLEALAFYLLLTTCTADAFQFCIRRGLKEALLWDAVLDSNQTVELVVKQLADETNDTYWSRLYLFLLKNYDPTFHPTLYNPFIQQIVPPVKENPEEVARYEEKALIDEDSLFSLICFSGFWI